MSYYDIFVTANLQILTSFTAELQQNMATFNVELNQRANKDGLHSVFIRINETGKTPVRDMLDFKIPKEHFNKKAKYGKWIRVNNYNHAKYNAQIEDKITELKAKYELLSNSGQNAIKVIKQPMKEIFPEAITEMERVITLDEYLKEYLSVFEVNSAVGYFRHVKSKLQKFRDFIGGEINIKKITKADIQKYKLHLQTQEIYVKKYDKTIKLSGVTINDNLKRVHAMFEEADDAGIIDFDPFPKKIRVKEIESDPFRLNADEIKAFEKLNVPKIDGNKKWPYIAYKMYLFAYYNAGIRVGDCLQIRMGSVTKDGRLEYEMDKTGFKKSIALNKKAKAIFDEFYDPRAPKHHYLFPALDSLEAYASFVTYEQKTKMPRKIETRLFNQKSAKASLINQALETLSSMAKLDRIARFHSNRHSFTEKARIKSKESNDKISLYDIKNMLGHRSIVTTEKYMKKFDKDSLDEAMGAIFED